MIFFFLKVTPKNHCNKSNNYTISFMDVSLINHNFIYTEIFCFIYFFSKTHFHIPIVFSPKTEINKITPLSLVSVFFSPFPTLLLSWWKSFFFCFIRLKANKLDGFQNSNTFTNPTPANIFLFHSFLISLFVLLSAPPCFFRSLGIFRHLHCVFVLFTLAYE